MKNKVTVTGVNILFFVFAMLFLLFQVILLAFTVKYGENFIDKNTYKIILVNEFVLILIPVLVYSFVKRLNFKEVFRLNKLEIPPILLIIAISIPAYFTAMMLNTAVVYILQFLGDVPNQPIPVPNNLYELILGILIIAVTPAICEEALHRGLLLRAYENRGSMKAVFIVSIFFGIFHFDITNLLGPIFLGVLIGYYVLRTNSIFAGVLAHFLNNTIAELFQYFGRNGEAIQNKITVSNEEMGFCIVYGVAGLIIVGLFVLLLKNVTEGKTVLRKPISSISNDITSILSHWPVIAVSILYFLLMVLYLLTVFVSKHAGVLK